jgi:hydroxymethylbilane synthase
MVAKELTRRTGQPVELVEIRTTGDAIQDRPLRDIGGKGLFTKEIEEALFRSEVDFAVHSLKDLPTRGPKGLVLASVPTRASPWDCLVGSTWEGLKPGARVGTGSQRRRVQIEAARPDVEVVPIRGNVDTRLSMVSDGRMDAVVVALAGLERLGRADEATAVLRMDALIPAAAQGALALQCRQGDSRVLEALESLHDADTARCIAVERSFLGTLEGDCSVPAGCYAWVEGEQLVAHGCFADEAGLRRMLLRSDLLHGFALGRDLARRLLRGEGDAVAPR